MDAGSAPPTGRGGGASSPGLGSRKGEVAVPVVEIKKKTITMVGSVALLINNVTGGSMVVLPQTFQEAGWVLPVLALMGVGALSVICGIMMIECMTLVPGNNRFQKRLEYTNIAHIYFPTWLYWIAQLFYQFCILAQNVAMIIQSVQVMDFTLVALTGYTCAIPTFAPGFQFTCSVDFTTDGVSPFPADWYLVSLGWLVTTIIVMPLGFIDLDDNDAVQKGGWFAVMTIVGVWCALAVNQPDGLIYVTHFGGKYDNLMGTVLFNFAIVYTIPSWANEKRPSVPIKKALGVSMTGAVVLFSVLGYCGGAGFPPPTNNQTLLNQIYALGTKISSITFYLFPACVNLTTIPVNSIMQRYNLKEAGVCGKKQAAFWGVVSPWLIAIPLYTGSGYQTLVTWSGLVLLSSVNFIFPPILYILAIKKYGTGPHAIRTLLEEAQLTHHPSKADGLGSLTARRKQLAGTHGSNAGGDHTLELAAAALITKEAQPPSTEVKVLNGDKDNNTFVAIGSPPDKYIDDGNGGGASRVTTPEQMATTVPTEPNTASSNPPAAAVNVAEEKTQPPVSARSSSVSGSGSSSAREVDSGSKKIFIIKVQPDHTRNRSSMDKIPATDASAAPATTPAAVPTTDAPVNATATSSASLETQPNPLPFPNAPLTPKSHTLPPLEKPASVIKETEVVIFKSELTVNTTSPAPTVAATPPTESSSNNTTTGGQNPLIRIRLGQNLPNEPSSGDLSASSKKPTILRAGTSDYSGPPQPPAYDAATGLTSVPSGSPNEIASPSNVHSVIRPDGGANAASANEDLPGYVADGLEEEVGEETEEEREEREHALRTAEKEEMRRQRTLKKLRKKREKAAAAASNPEEVAKAHETIQPLDLTPPSIKQEPLHFLGWCLTLPWHLAFYITVPHSATTARFSKYWYVTLFMICLWSVVISFFVVWTSTEFAIVSGFHAFAFGVFIVGFAMRSPNLLTEFNSFKNDTGDLNRIFSNSVWQILICLPLPWVLYSLAHNGDPFVVYSGTQAIFALTMFLLSSLTLIMFKNYDWYMLRPVALASVAIFVLYVLEVFLLDYNVVMNLDSSC